MPRPAKQATIRIPNNWSPRPYQLPALQKFAAGIRDQFHVWHRRAGKDLLSMNHAAVQSQLEVGAYWHVLPYLVQARKALWHGIGKDGVRFIDQAFPPEIRKSTRDHEMMIEFINGSTWQLVGADNYNALVGSNPRGCVFSEWALCDPAAWDYVRPILLENKGWVWFITTYRGKNHAYTMFERLKDNAEWFCSKLTVNDTRDFDGAPIITPADIERERLEGMDEGMIQQEYFCDPLAAFTGSYYGGEIQKLKLQGRLTAVTHDPKFPVYCVWDLGWVDHLTCIFIQPHGNESNVIGSRSWRMTTIPDALADIRKTFPWEADTHVLPWDAAKSSLETGSTWQQVFEDQRCQTEIAPKVSVFEGIEQVRLFLPTCSIDIEKRPWAPDGNNLLLIESLTGYRTELRKGQPGVFQRSPAHTWESHLADALRYYAVFRSSGGLTLGEWGPAPDWSRHDRAVI
jgi:phage terminase large subunit